MTLVGRGKSGVFIMYLLPANPRSDFMGAKILDIYNILIGHGIPGNGKSLETLKLEVSTGV
jgi:hypothetical protein